MPDVELSGARLSYNVVECTGTETGVPFVWGHGLTSSRADEDVVPLIDSAVIARDREVLRYDARGHGLSSDLDQPADGGWAALARDQIALIDHLGWQHVVIGGASMGTGTALHAALELGDRLRGLVLVIPPTAWETRATAPEYEQMAVAVERGGTAVIESVTRATPPADPFLDDPDWVERRANVIAAVGARRLAASLRSAGTTDLPDPDALATITAPTLILAWTGDSGHPVSTAERLDAVLPNSSLVVSSTRAEFDTWTERCAAFLADC